ncbi:adult-specific cuticular protein ACP-20-like [Euwallacea fornicatus]|uniref:adult-specific cuticular protein ACP-20-like n=1 Tax=Euwallacea fornicatus TaxID=995702 RepID=UPI00338FB6A5
MSPLQAFLFVFVATNAVLAQYFHSSHDQGHQADYHTVPHYQFEYGVNDPYSDDMKSQQEYREHDHVRGGYSLKEPDGTRRIVEYVAGPHSGFHAVVRRVGHAQHPAVYGKHGHYQGGIGGTSYAGVTHWGHGSGR